MGFKVAPPPPPKPVIPSLVGQNILAQYYSQRQQSYTKHWPVQWGAAGPVIPSLIFDQYYSQRQQGYAKQWGVAGPVIPSLVGLNI